MLLPEWSSRPRPVIGMLHAPPLPGSCDYGGDFDRVRRHVIRDADTLVSGGVDGLMLENFGDSPFYPSRVPAVTVAAMTSLATDLKSRFEVPFGINVLRNDGQSALAIAHVCGASFIRVNVLCGARVADQGLLQAIAHDLLRDRANLRAQSVQIWSDVDVKHSSALSERPLHDEVRDLIDRAKTDAVIVSGFATGQPIDPDTLRRVKLAAGQSPVIIGSGATPELVHQLIPFADALIVGSSLKTDGQARNPVDLDRVKRIVEAVNLHTTSN